jgi:uncharacterized protein YqeY
MSLAEQIDQDLAGALKSGQAVQVATLRLIKSSLKNEQIKLGHELSDSEAQKVLSREAKQRRDSIEAYTLGGREGLAADERQELSIIESYLPAKLSEAELVGIIDEVVVSLGKDAPVGQIIGQVVAKTAGQADGAEVARLVRTRLDA